mgnify:FL=1
MREACRIKTEGLAYAERIFNTVRDMSKDGPGVTRQGYGPVESRVLDYLEGLGRELDLEIEKDAAGNVWMTLPGADRTLPAFVAGSHADSVPQGGNFDGLAGIVAVLTVLWWMRHTNFTPKRDVRALLLRCEESSFFGKAYVGSLGMMGRLTEADLQLKHRTTGETLEAAVRSQGVDPSALVTGRPVVDTSKIAAFVELHIEQGPMLDRNPEVRTAVVTGIRGNIRHKRVVCHGETAHSGALDRIYRHDAVMATARLLTRMEDRWTEWNEAGKDLVFTTGVLTTAPTAAISVIPGETTFTIDMRSLSTDVLEGFHTLLLEEARRIEAERGVRFEFDNALRTAPAVVDAALSDRLVESARHAGVPAMRLASGAGHDTAVLANAGIPVAMIFIANQNGSHNPHEAMKLEDFMAGTAVLWNTVKRFDE